MPREYSITNFVPGDPFVVMNTDMYYDLFKVSGSNNLNDLAIFNRDIGGGGSVVSGQVPTIMGMPIYVTPHLVTTPIPLVPHGNLTCSIKHLPMVMR